MRVILNTVFKTFLNIFIVLLLVVSMGGAYFLGYTEGLLEGRTGTKKVYDNYLRRTLEDFASSKEIVVVPTNVPKSQPAKAPSQPVRENSYARESNWGGPDLWEAVNKRRTELGVNPLNQKDNLCTIASIRLNQLLELGKLDGHEGFSNMGEERPDLKKILDNYSTVAEFLAVGGDSAQDTVALWENSLGHKKLLTGGEYVWGCIYAQESFAVAIVAF